MQYSDLSDDEIGQLEDKVDSYAEGVLLIPNERLTSAIALASWGKLMEREKARRYCKSS